MNCKLGEQAHQHNSSCPHSQCFDRKNKADNTICKVLKSPNSTSHNPRCTFPSAKHFPTITGDKADIRIKGLRKGDDSTEINHTLILNFQLSWHCEAITHILERSDTLVHHKEIQPPIPSDCILKAIKCFHELHQITFQGPVFKTSSIRKLHSKYYKFSSGTAADRDLSFRLLRSLLIILPATFVLLIWCFTYE